MDDENIKRLHEKEIDNMGKDTVQDDQVEHKYSLL